VLHAGVVRRLNAAWAGRMQPVHPHSIRGLNPNDFYRNLNGTRALYLVPKRRDRLGTTFSERL